jgi:hypothetical protein
MSRSDLLHGSAACHSTECIHGMEEVEGSIPSSST